jgi:hypothetical protein
MQIRFSRLGRWQKIHLSHIISGLRRLGLLTAQALKKRMHEDIGSIPDSAVIQTRSVVQPGSIDSNLCFIGKIKSFKRDIKLHKIESSERLDSLMSISSCILFKLCEWYTVVFASICFVA